MMVRWFSWLVVLGIVLPSMVACDVQSQKGDDLSSIGITFLTRAGCPKSPTMWKNLESALGEMGIAASVATVDLGDLAPDDFRTGYGTPTVLVNDEDLFGRSKPAAATPM